MQRSTVVFLLLLLVLAGAYYYLNNREQPADIALTGEPEVPTAYLFTAEDGLPTRIHVEASTGEVVELERNEAGAWALVLPIEAEADQAAAEAAATQVTTLRILDEVPDVEPDIVGLENPEYSLRIRFTSGVERKAEVGVITPTESGYYVRNEQGRILIVSRDALDALLTLLAHPPYLQTPTPSPIPPTSTPVRPTGTPEAGPEATATPVP